MLMFTAADAAARARIHQKIVTHNTKVECVRGARALSSRCIHCSRRGGAVVTLRCTDEQHGKFFFFKKSDNINARIGEYRN